MAFEMKGMSAAAGEQAPPDLLRAMLAQVMQAAVQGEFERFMGAGRSSVASISLRRSR